MDAIRPSGPGKGEILGKQAKDFAQGEQAAIAREVTGDDGWVPLIDW